MLNEALWHAYAERMIDGAAAAAALACFLLLTFYFHAAPRAAGDGRVPTLVVLGSGGHTTEMLRLLGGLDASRYGPVTLVVAASDTTSAAKAAGMLPSDLDATWATIPRAREVGQPFVAAVPTTLRALCAAAAVVYRARPRLVLCNGPGTCVPVVAWAFVARTLRPVTWFVGVGSRPAIVYVESAARTKTMSLTGRILYTTRLADEVFVQWEGLARRYPRAKFAGRVC